MTLRAYRLPYTQRERLAGSVSSAVATSDSTGVMPEPGDDRAVVPGAVRVERGGEVAQRRQHVDGVAGAQRAARRTRRRRRRGSRLTPIRSRPRSASSAGVEQIEYDRRTSSPLSGSTGARSGAGRPGRRTPPAAPAGTAKVMATASSVSRSTAATGSGWKTGRRRTGPGDRDGHQSALTGRTARGRRGSATATCRRSSRTG